MKELTRFRQFLNEGKKDTLRSLIQDLTSVEYETFADDAGVDPEDGAEMEEFIASISDQEADKYISMLKEVNEDKNEELKEGAFGDKAKVALENSLTGMAKDMVEDGTLFAEGGNVTYDEADLKDGATPEQIEAIDQIKMAVIKMGGRVSYGDIDGDGILTYMYLVVDEAPTYDAVLKVITKESEGDNLFYDVFKSNK